MASASLPRARMISSQVPGETGGFRPYLVPGVYRERLTHISNRSVCPYGWTGIVAATLFSAMVTYLSTNSECYPRSSCIYWPMLLLAGACLCLQSTSQKGDGLILGHNHRLATVRETTPNRCRVRWQGDGTPTRHRSGTALASGRQA